MLSQGRASRLIELVRYYQAGALNALFGYGLYALLVFAGLNLFLAQMLSHLLGVLFNYFTYSRHVFKGAASAKGRFILSYGINYLLSVSILAALTRFGASAYLAGLLTIVIVSVINYLMLRHMVFVRRPEA